MSGVAKAAARQLSLPTLRPVAEVVTKLASAGVVEHGAIFTRRSVVDFGLDLVGYSDLSEMTSLKTFVTALAGHVAAEAARS